MAKQWGNRDKVDVLPHIAKQFQGQVLWGTQYKHYDNKDIYNVTGHWAKQERAHYSRGTKVFCGARIHKYFACVDGGCGYKNGKLWALDFPSMDTYSQPIIDEVTC